MRRTLLAVLMCVAFQHATPDARQTADGARFDSASITVNASNGASGGCCRILPDGRVTASNVTVRQLIQSAYQRYIFDERPMSDLPAWADSIRFDIAAAAPAAPAFDADGAAPQLASMLRNLLADRFKLRIRIEASERPTRGRRDSSRRDSTSRPLRSQLQTLRYEGVNLLVAAGAARARVEAGQRTR